MTQLLFLLALSKAAKGEPFSKPQNFGINFQTIKNVQLTTESQSNKALASYLNGETEVSSAYDFTGSDGKIISGHVRVDIENDEYVIEGGLDKRRSLDGIQQSFHLFKFFPMSYNIQPIELLHFMSPHGDWCETG